jgi:hypothetical protein
MFETCGTASGSRLMAYGSGTSTPVTCGDSAGADDEKRAKERGGAEAGDEQTRYTSKRLAQQDGGEAAQARGRTSCDNSRTDGGQ